MEPLKKSARAVSERFCTKLRFENRRNTFCISRFSNRKVGKKDPLSAAADLFRGSLSQNKPQVVCADSLRFSITILLTASVHALILFLN